MKWGHLAELASVSFLICSVREMHFAFCDYVHAVHFDFMSDVESWIFIALEN